jgi:hypothetical protein
MAFDFGTSDPYMVEGYYAVPVNEFLTITPALIYGDLGTGGAMTTTSTVLSALPSASRLQFL